MRLPLISRNFFGANGLLLSLIAVAAPFSLCDSKENHLRLGASVKDVRTIIILLSVNPTNQV
jgi:hypothetical protein